MKKKKKNILTDFERCKQGLPQADRVALDEYFADFEAHIALSRDDRALLRADAEAALLRYAAMGVPLGEALCRLSIDKLGGFYARPPVLWYALDDAAKIYPLSLRYDRMSVFRLSAHMKQQVLPELLQMALTFTIKRFPSFATTVKKGFFWHYLDTAKRRYSIERERAVPCRPLKISESGSQSFRVLYYNDRISVEYFHILTDGAGGMVFLKTLVAEYLRLLGVEVPCTDGVLDINAPPAERETANEFRRAPTNVKTSGFLDKQAVQLSGRLSWRKPCRVLHFKLDAPALKKAAAERGASVTAYMLSLLFVASGRAIDGHNGIVNIQVPVNMRKYYPSDTLRNFALYFGVKLPVCDLAEAQPLLGEISRQLEVKGSLAAMEEMMRSTVRMVDMMRYIPLVIKAPVARQIYGFLGDGVFTGTLSNLGVVRLPQEMAEELTGMDFVLGTAQTQRASCAMVTLGGTATLSISKSTADPTFEETLFRLLRADGVPTRVEGSELYEN